jgi:hypothetical protein
VTDYEQDGGLFPLPPGWTESTDNRAGRDDVVWRRSTETPESTLGHALTAFDITASMPARELAVHLADALRARGFLPVAP